MQRKRHRTDGQAQLSDLRERFMGQGFKSSAIGVVLWVSAAGGLIGDESAAPFGLEKREPWTTSRLVGTPEPPPPYTVERIYPELTFKNPVFIAQEPGTNRIVVAELDGKIVAFPKDNATPEAVQVLLETGRQIYAFSFHPDYETNGQIFVFSPTEPGVKGEDQMSRVSRFTADLTHPRTVNPETEQIIIEWKAGGHNGGEAIIGPDGYLYICTGDGTSTSDINSTGQGVDDLHSVMLRIDVENPDEGRAYSIPPDNPFINYPGARPEVWAHGFRNPWRISFDSAGRLWCGDVGQDLWEMIWLVEKGGNYGWSVQEGSHPFHSHKALGPGPILPPVVEHHHTECRSITGGYVYEGDKHPELNGMYFYGDYEYGMIWAFRHDGQKVVDWQVLADTPLRIPTFGVSRDGEILVVDHLTGELYELVKAPTIESGSEFPRRLSETGLFASVADHQLAAGVVPYTVNAPQWIDDAAKERYVALPGTSQITFVEKSGNAKTWEFEDGTVAAETISLDMEAGNAASSKRLETRILVKQQNHWLGYSYLWNDEQTDATLVDAPGRDLTLSIVDADAPGGVRQQTWHVPSRNECMVCHSRAAAFVLGLRTLQMNKPHDYSGIVDNQLRAFDHAGFFTEPLPKPASEYPALANPYDETADLEARARGYLHVNCSVCHVDSGGGNSRMVLTIETPLMETKLVRERPIHGDFGLTDASLVTPGDPFASVLFYRLSKLGRGRMPLVGTYVNDLQAMELFHDWILNTKAFDVEADRYPSRQEHADYDAAVDALTQSAASAEQRALVLDDMLSSTRRALLLARAVARAELPDALKTDAITHAAAHNDVNVRDLFERFLPESQRTKRLGESINVAALLEMPGDVDRGRDLFLHASGLQCKACHTIRGVGGALGPDLSQIGKKHKPRELLDSLLDPSKTVDPKFAAHVLVTTEGKVLTGLLVERTDEQVTLKVFTDGKAEEVRVPAGDVDELLEQKKSLMPDGQLRDLTAEQVADLLAFLCSLTDDPPAAPSGQ
ncbi:MAG: PQQ-dependent sugar dehydrogenase [Planctomycetaceae bacterium]|nr:PQQ-dependent sugar dehydrogenase [Planctomycetaceae bacterium]